MGSVAAIMAMRRINNKACSSRCACLPLSRSRPTSLFTRLGLWLMSLALHRPWLTACSLLRKHNEWLGRRAKLIENMCWTRMVDGETSVVFCARISDRCNMTSDVMAGLPLDASPRGFARSIIVTAGRIELSTECIYAAVRQANQLCCRC